MKSIKLNFLLLLLILSIVRCYAESEDSLLPPWAQKALSETKFSFLKTAKPWEFSKFDYYKEPKSTAIPMPEKVQMAFQNEAAKDFKDLIDFNLDASAYIESGEQKLPDPREIYSTVYAFKGPENILVYAMHIKGWGYVGDSIGNSYYVVLYDSKRDLIASSPISIDTQFGDIGTDRPDLPPTVVKPLISFEDVTADGNPLFVVEQNLHSGTDNCVLYRYYAIRPDFSLVDVLDLETRVPPYGKWWNAGYAELDRKIIAGQKNQITIGITLEGLEVPAIQVGSMILKRTDPLSPFKIDKKLPGKKLEDLFDPYYLGTTFGNW